MGWGGTARSGSKPRWRRARRGVLPAWALAIATAWGAAAAEENAAYLSDR